MGIDTLARQPHRGDICVFAGAVAESVNYVSMSQMYTRIPCNQHPVAIFRHETQEVFNVQYRAVKYSSCIKTDSKHGPPKRWRGEKRDTREGKQPSHGVLQFML